MAMLNGREMFFGIVGQASGGGMSTDIIADNYDSTVQYVPGNYCIQQNQLYRCHTSTTGDFDSSKWQLIQIMDEVQSVVTSLGGLNLVKCTQAQYNAITTPDSNTVYLIVG